MYEYKTKFFLLPIFSIFALFYFLPHSLRADETENSEPQVKVEYVNFDSQDFEKNSESDALIELSKSKNEDISNDELHQNNEINLNNETHSSIGKSTDFNAEGIIKNIPNGANKTGVSTDCNPYFLSKSFSKKETASEFAKRLNLFFLKCGDQLHKGENKSLTGLIEFARAKYNVNENPNIKKVVFKFKDGTTVNGFISVKDLIIKRPWVILKCGVFCAAEFGPSISNFTMALFDQSPFNLILLGNRTGTDHILANSSLMIGGFLESYDFFMVGRWLKEVSDFRNSVESLHIMGVSLAGNAALYSAYLASNYQSQNKPQLFDSVSAICPVVNLKPTIDNMYSENLKGEIFSRLTWSELSKVKQVLTEGREFFQSDSLPQPKEFPNMLATLTSRYASLWANNPLNESKAKPIRTIEDLWHNGEFTSLDLKKIKTPLFVWASKDDIVVNNLLNTNILLNSKLARANSNIGIVNLPLGNHCAFSTAYGYNTTAQVLKSFVINNSHEFKTQRTSFSIPISFKKILENQEIHLHQIWSAIKKSSQLKLTLEFFKKSSDIFCKTTTINDVDGCIRTLVLNVDKSNLGLNFLKDPQNELEAQAQTRWLNTNVILKSKGKFIDRTSNEPDSIEWTP